MKDEIILHLDFRHFIFPTELHFPIELHFSFLYGFQIMRFHILQLNFVLNGISPSKATQFIYVLNHYK